MKTKLLTVLSTLLFCLPTINAADAPAMPQPVKEHEWLKQFVGEWDTTTEIFAAPDQPSLKAAGHESAKMIGGFWMMGENEGEMMGQTFTGIMTLGYDPEKKRYIGTWVDSNTSTLWNYKGTLDEGGKILTLESEGYCPMEGQVCQFKDTVEFKSKDERVLTGARLGKDGKWTKMMTVTAKRKK